MSKEVTVERERNRERMAARYAEDPQHQLDISQKWYDENMRGNPDRIQDKTLRRRYGITLEDFKEMKSEQGEKCASCGDSLVPGILTQVDHCHETGKVRGILCKSCNGALGFLKDDPMRVSALLNYIGEKSYV
jgi:predicted RNA-binding Zn-ribbon protein involved in translation (DUF1610 family)